MWTMNMAVLHLPVYTVLLVGYVQAGVADGDVTPRLTFSYNAKERTAKRFSASGVVNFTTLHLSNEDKTLYVGAREILFALNLTDISEVTLHRNFTWETPDRKREECSFKGKDLQASEPPM